MRKMSRLQIEKKIYVGCALIVIKLFLINIYIVVVFIFFYISNSKFKF